jgi:cation diffusion facilitator CzcD-associated flavoprotein CzcO
MTMSDQRVVVIGAGPAGLAAAAELRRAGVPALVLEKASAVGASWRGRYDRLRLNTCRWTSKLPRGRYAPGTPLFPSRDQIVKHLEDYAEQNELDVRLGTKVERIDREGDAWVIRTSSGDLPASQVIVTTGYEHTPSIPDWPGRERFTGQLLHAAEYRNAEPFRGKEALVVGPGCSGMEIAYDLVEGGAGRVRLAVRTPPNIMLRAQGGLPGDLPAIALLRLPARLADAPAKLIRRFAIGDLTEYGLPQPREGLFTRHHREGKAPAIVDKEVIDAIRDRRIEIVPGLESLDETGVTLANGTRIEPDAVIAATGYRCGLESMVGHLGVLDERGVPRALRGVEAAPGMRFIGYMPRPGQIGYMGGEARRAVKALARETGGVPRSGPSSPATRARART